MYQGRMKTGIKAQQSSFKVPQALPTIDERKHVYLLLLY